MNQWEVNIKYITIILAIYLYSLPTSAVAYVGPGAGLSAIGSILAFLGAILLIIVGFFWYPLKRLIKGKKASSSEEDPEVKLNDEDVEESPLK